MHRVPTPSVPRIAVNQSFSIPSREPEEAARVERLSYSIPEAASAIGVSESTVKRLIHKGELECIKLLRRTVVPVASIAKLLGS
jgi:excisionase family DNA binding protein